MKHFSKKFFLYLLFTNYFSCYGDISGYMEAIEVLVPGREDILQIPYFSGSASYVNGGVTFMYPAGLFSSTPSLRISIEENVTNYSNSQVFVPFITSSTTSSVTVRVNLVTSLTVSEAATDEIIVHIFANEV
jgi:hypothetical protein